MKKAAYSVVTALLLLTSACATGTDISGERAQESKVQTQRALGNQVAIERSANPKESYMYNAEGNFTGTSFRSIGSNHHHLGTDEDKIREIIGLQGYDAGRVIIAGRHAWVNVDLPKNLSDKDKKSVMDQLETALKRGIPRYEVHINARF